MARYSPHFMLIFFLCWSSVAIGAEKISQIRIFTPSVELIHELKRENFDVIAVKPGKMMDLFVTASDLIRIEKKGLPYTVIHEDYTAFVVNRALREGDVSPGSMGGFHTFEEVVAFLDALQVAYPGIVSTKFSVGTSLEGQPLWVIKVSDNVLVDESEIEVFYNSLTHAREPQGMETLLYFLDYLTTNYGVDERVTFLVDNREMFFMPVVNPDGYLWNQTTDPGGGGYWRKNRRGNGSSVWGVDLNRNFGYQWGYDNSGSSPYQSDEDYRGTDPFSEPETQVVRDFCTTRDFRTALNYHTHGNVVIRPFGYANVPLNPASDINIYDTWGSLLTAVNHYEYGDIYSTIGYQANGGADDWMYGDQTLKPKIFSFTPELGSWNDGFWPAPSRIEPIAQENLEMNFLIAYLAGQYCYFQEIDWNYSDENANGHPDAGETADVTFSVLSLGLETASAVQVSLIVQHNDVTIDNQVISLGDLLTLEVANNNLNPVEVTFGPSLLTGDEVAFELQLAVDGVVLEKKNIVVLIGAPELCFTDDCETGLAHWTTSGTWNTTTGSYHSATTSFTDSPGGDYSNYADATLRLNETLDLTALANPVLTFWTRWDIESRWDFGQVQISTDGGGSWISLAGKYTTVGSGDGAQPAGEPGYDGTRETWVQETIDLTSFRDNQNLLLQFRLRTDSSLTEDGWYIDDIRIEGYLAANVPTLTPLALILLLTGISAAILRNRG
ncbi:M14 family zinc carboxypeptidase [candidate division CSSED10-310 bacterium]|uniref:M14 family zinc carboxypeptidase n=1 Tax=candidate division CSSED10-310 bacterium TaxID=2855610 RepID=A0ABV6Z1G9_UNCC1